MKIMVAMKILSQTQKNRCEDPENEDVDEGSCWRLRSLLILGKEVTCKLLWFLEEFMLLDLICILTCFRDISPWINRHSHLRRWDMDHLLLWPYLGPSTEKG